jgi:hypothetical protein
LNKQHFSPTLLRDKYFIYSLLNWKRHSDSRECLKQCIEKTIAIFSMSDIFLRNNQNFVFHTFNILDRRISRASKKYPYTDSVDGQKKGYDDKPLTSNDDKYSIRSGMKRSIEDEFSTHIGKNLVCNINFILKALPKIDLSDCAPENLKDDYDFNLLMLFHQNVTFTRIGKEATSQLEEYTNSCNDDERKKCIASFNKTLSARYDKLQ